MIFYIFAILSKFDYTVLRIGQLKILIAITKDLSCNHISVVNGRSENMTEGQKPAIAANGVAMTNISSQITYDDNKK